MARLSTTVTNNLFGASGYSGISGTSGYSGISGIDSTINWIRKTSNYTSIPGDRLLADTTVGTFTITLPLNPLSGKSVSIADGGNFNNTPLTVSGNGSTFEGTSENVLILNIGGAIFDFVYDGTTWQVYARMPGGSGYSGVSGVSGYSGLSGASGYSGLSGASGYSGLSGASGYSGLSGTSGTSGTSGFSGINGIIGINGASGFSGTSGASGYSGISGASGTSGTSGFSGINGIIGINGASGFSGTSGASGVSGYSGASGSTASVTLASISGALGYTPATTISPTFTGTPSAPTATSGTNTTQIATTAFVRTEVTNLVASAPSTLDTLNELATALGNDANFSTTISTALGLKAPLASPTFTGTVSGITKAMVGLGNVENTSDANKPISTATQTALDGLQTDINNRVTIYTLSKFGGEMDYALSLKAPIASPTFTGTVSTSTSFFAGSATAYSEIYNDAIRVNVGSNKTEIFSNSIHINGSNVWHAGNDGSGSGLDADLLDGQDGSYYTTAGNLSGTIPTGVLGNSSMYIGTTNLALNRGSGAQTLSGISIDGSAGSCTGNAATATNSSQLGGVSWGNVNTSILPNATNSYDLGSSSQAWRNIYTNDLHLSNEAKPEGNDIDGTTGNWTIQEGEEHLYILNNKNGKKYRFKLEEIV